MNYTDIHRFKDFADEKLKGTHQEIEDVFGKEIIIVDYVIFECGKLNKDCLKLQYKYCDGTDDLYVVCTYSGVLKKAILKYEDKLPFITVINKNKSKNYYEFT